MPVFKDSEAKVFELAPEGDYVLRVVEFECGISKGRQTAGSDSYDVKFLVESKGSTFFDTLIDHPSCDWKIDLFLKSAGIRIAKGEAYEFRKDKAEYEGIRWVDPIGLRLWAKVKIEPSQKDPTKKYNKVAVFYTDKPKLPRHVEADPMLADSPEPETTTQAQGDDVPW
jgi:hypothetical protein